MEFADELRTLIDRYITPQSKPNAYIKVTSALDEQMQRLDRDADKFSDDELQGDD